MKKIIKPLEIKSENFTNYGDLISSDIVEPININDGYATCNLFQIIFCITIEIVLK